MTEDDEQRYRLPRTVMPRRYGLVLEPDLAAGSFVGTEDVAVDVREAVSEIVMNAVDLDIAGGYLTSEDGGRVEISEVRLDPETERAHLVLDAQADPGGWTLHLDFRGELNDKLVGFYRSTYQGPDGGTEVIATTHFEATDARRAFPSWDEPDLKAVFGVTLIVAPDLTALSNGPEIQRTTLDDGRVRLVFADTMSMSTYLVAFVVGHLELTDPVDAGGVPTRVAHVPGKGPLAAFALEIGAHSLKWFAEYYGIPYPDAKVDHIALPDFAQGAMENLGCITYREAALLVDPATSTHGEQLDVAETVAHELAHMWFGDLVTMRWWNGLWLNEAFATFMAMLAVDAYRPDWEVWNQFARSRSAALEVDALASTRSIEYPVHSPDDANGMFDTLFGGPPRKAESLLIQREMDLAASIQAVTEEIVLRLTRSLATQTGQKNLCLAGGVALNCVANGKVLRHQAMHSHILTKKTTKRKRHLRKAALVSPAFEKTLRQLLH